jgi:hypothetical protein
MLPSTGTIILKGTTGNTNAVSIEIYGTPTNLSLFGTNAKTLYGWVSGNIQLTLFRGKCWANCGCDAYCNCDANCGCDVNCACDACPAPDVPLRMSDGTEKLAGDIVVGDVVVAWDEKTKTLSTRRVTRAERETNYRMRLTLSSGKVGEFAINHRFLTHQHQWVELQELRVGDLLSTGVTVLATAATGPGPVVSMTVEDLHTYITLGVVSHNAKQCPPGA